MGDSPDQIDLRQYVSTRSNAAFANLVKRHAGWVYALAVRQVRDPVSAEDVTQAAFILLAQKAERLQARTNVAAWLFKVVHFEINLLRRSEARRRAREREFAADQQTQFNWELHGPALDEAVADLSARDRDCILLRYYGGLPFRDVGEVLSISEDAARKRVDRALEKLKTLLARRGVNAETAGSAVIAAQLNSPLPASLEGKFGAFDSSTNAQVLARQTETAMRNSWLKSVVAGGAVVVAVLAVIVSVALAMQQSPAPQVAVPASTRPTVAAKAPSNTPDLLLGRVVDFSGKPVAGATIFGQSISSGIRPPIGPVISGADGTFELTVPAGLASARFGPNVQLAIHADGYGWGGGRLIGTQRLDVELPPATRRRFVFRDPTNTPVTGLRISIEKIQPLNGEVDAGVTFTSEMATQSERVTDANGAVEWGDLPLDSTIQLAWNDPRFEKAWNLTSSFEIHNVAKVTDVQVSLRPAASIRGRITSADGKPLGGINLQLSGDITRGKTRSFVASAAVTGSAGDFTFASLPPGEYMLYQGNAANSVDIPPSEWTFPAIAPITIASAESTQLAAIVATRGGVIEGQVLDVKTGQPLADADVGGESLAHPRLAGHEYALTDANGRYTLRVPAGNASISANANGYLPADTASVTVDEGQTVHRDFKLQKSEGKPSEGSVVFEDGTPASGARVIYGAEKGGRFFTAADRDGRFQYSPDRSPSPREPAFSGRR